MIRKSNMYGYTDYNGPSQSHQEAFIDEQEVDDPLRVGAWLEGDSLAPPCGSSVSIVRSLIDFAFEYKLEILQSKSETVVNSCAPEVLYDLGSGDGRVCLEAYWNFCVNGAFKNLCCVAVEIEEDLIERFQDLVRQLPEENCSSSCGNNENLRLDHSSRLYAVQADLCDVLKFLILSQTVNEQETEVIEASILASSKSNTVPVLLVRNVQLHRPSIITLYLLPDAIRLIEPALIKLMKMNEDLIIICNTWGMTTVSAVRVVDAIDSSTGLTTKLFLYAASNITS